MHQTRGILRRLALASATLLVVACSPKPDSDGPDTGDSEPPSVSATVDSNGGTVSSDNVELRLGPGALDSETDIEIVRTDAAAPDGFQAASPVYRFKPDGLTFDKPVEVEFALNESVEQPTIYWTKKDGEGFRQLNAAGREGNRVIARVDHFSRGFAGSRSGCTSHRECPGNIPCVAGYCGGPQCDNGKTDRGETDTDCGGVNCDPCGLGENCAVDADCRVGRCVGSGVDGTCQMPSMTDAGNGGSDDVDAGGGGGGSSECPTAKAVGGVKGAERPGSADIATLPLKTIELSGAGSTDPDGTIDRYEWSFLDKPETSSATLQPDATAEQPELFLDAAGTYRLELTAYDAAGNASCGESAEVRIRAIPDDDVYIEVAWATPGDSNPDDTTGSDVDLHYHSAGSPWNDPSSDTFAGNPTGGPGELVRAEADGEGPESLEDSNPSAGDYEIGIHYNQARGLGPVSVTTRIYIRGMLAEEIADQELSDENAFRHNATVTWPQATVTATGNAERQGFP
jgi:hypothetical protein